MRKMSGVLAARTWIVSGLLALALATGTWTVAAQEGPYAFQIRAGGTLPVGAFRDDARGWEEKAGSGSSLGMGFTFPLHWLLGGYLGFSQHRFSCDEDVCPEGEAWISTGFDIAIRMVMGDRNVRPWAQGGFHTPRIEGRVSEGEGGRNIRSHGGSGYEAGGGLLVKVGERMSLSPGVRYGSVDVPFPGRPTMMLRYLVFDLGLVVGF
jgi:hypothetical protein